MRLLLLLALLAAVATTTPGCRPAEAPPPPACAFAADGVCDEPRNCALGTDVDDCDAQCARDPAGAPAACSFRGVPSPAPARPPVPAENGSGGRGGPRGVWEGTIEARGADPGRMVDRRYRVYVPLRYDPTQPTPLLYVLGGFRVSMYSLPSYTEVERTADQNGFIVVYLEADWRNFGARIGWVWAWYVYANEWRPGTWETSPDVDFVRRLTRHLESLYNIDRTRIFASGHSRGAGESIILAYLLPDMIAGYCSQSGFVGANNFDRFIATYAGPRRVPGVIIHGVEDPDVGFAEAELLDETLRGAGYVPAQDYLFLGLEGVTHRWQPALNQTFWDFLYDHPLPLEMVRR